MLKILSMCAALILATAAFSTSAEAQRGHGGRSMGGVGGGARIGSMGGSIGRVGSFSGARIAGPGRMGAYGGRAVYSGGRYYGGGRYAYGYGRYPYRRYGGWGGGYWPWGLGAGIAVAATWPYYGGYGYDDCVQWRPDWGWVNVCQYPYGGYYAY